LDASGADRQVSATVVRVNPTAQAGSRSVLVYLRLDRSTGFRQGLFAQGFVRPAVPGVSLPADVRSKMPDAPQIRPLDVVQAAARKADIDRDWAAAALAK
jgi:putative spermidine/putrescine transport system substrate-binding protein